MDARLWIDRCLRTCFWVGGPSFHCVSKSVRKTKGIEEKVALDGQQEMWRKARAKPQAGPYSGLDGIHPEDCQASECDLIPESDWLKSAVTAPTYPSRCRHTVWTIDDLPMCFLFAIVSNLLKPGIVCRSVMHILWGIVK